MDPVSIIDDLASTDLSLSEVAARHGLTIEALSTYLASDQAQETLDLVQSTLAIRTRLAAQIRFPIAIAALGSLLISHRSVACASPSATSAHDEARTSGDNGSPRHEARALRHQIELRRAAATLLRFANFNHRAHTRVSDPLRSSTPPEHQRDKRASAPSTTAQPAPLPFHSPAPPGSTHFTPRNSTSHSASFADLFAAAIAAVGVPADPAADPAGDPGDDCDDGAACPVPNHTTSPAADASPTTSISTTQAPALAAIDATATAFASSAASTVFPDAASAAVSAPVSSSTPITASSPAAACTLSSPSPSNQSSSTSSVPFPFPTPPCSSHLEYSYHSSSSSPLFLRGSVPPWLVPSYTSPRRPSAANRLAAAAGAPTHPP
jgi:hypothetical protein